MEARKTIGKIIDTIINIVLIIAVLTLFKHIVTSDNNKDILNELNNENITQTRCMA